MSYHGIPAYNELERFIDVPVNMYNFEETTGVTVVAAPKAKTINQ